MVARPRFGLARGTGLIHINLMDKSLPLLVKICGLSTVEAVDTAVAHGATHLGFIFFEKSPRNVTAERAFELSAHKGGAKTVAVTVNADDATLDAVVETMRPDMLQLHGLETAQRVRDVSRRYGLPVIKAVPVSVPDDLVVLNAYDGVADMLLLDAKAPKDAALPGGNGVAFDWSLLDDLSLTVPALLSGGIGQHNLKAALETVERVAPVAGLDLSSGVESAPGVKDNGKIAALLNACFATELSKDRS